MLLGNLPPPPPPPLPVYVVQLGDYLLLLGDIQLLRTECRIHRLSEEEAEAVFVQPQFPVLICYSL